MLRATALGVCLSLLVVETPACSHFHMNDDYGLTVRTMDFATVPGSQWSIATIPVGAPGLRSSEHAYAGFVKNASDVVVEDFVFAGINDAGLSCDLNALEGTKFPNKSATLDNIDAHLICRWALEGFGSVAELMKGLKSVNFFRSPSSVLPPTGQHWGFRDANGQGLVLEFLDGVMHANQDNNDGGKTGFGIMTNEPPLPWQIEAVKHLQWKQGLARSAVSMPGNWYPDERFQRIQLVKSGMPTPATYEEAVMQAVHTLNTITVPMGKQIGTDSGSSEGGSDHTQWGVIYDHKNKLFYWRSAVNQNLQRIRLEDAGLQTGGQKKYLAVFSEKLPWFSDAAAALAPNNGAAVGQAALVL